MEWTWTAQAESGMDEAAGMMPQGATTTLQSVPHCRALTHAKHGDRGNLSPPPASLTTRKYESYQRSILACCAPTRVPGDMHHDCRARSEITKLCQVVEHPADEIDACSCKPQANEPVQVDKKSAQHHKPLQRIPHLAALRAKTRML